MGIVDILLLGINRQNSDPVLMGCGSESASPARRKEEQHRTNLKLTKKDSRPLFNTSYTRTDTIIFHPCIGRQPTLIQTSIILISSHHGSASAYGAEHLPWFLLLFKFYPLSCPPLVLLSNRSTFAISREVTNPGFFDSFDAVCISKMGFSLCAVKRLSANLGVLRASQDAQDIKWISEMLITTLILDDTDPSINFIPNMAWPRLVTDPSLNNYNNTLTVGEEPGFTVSFNFTGVAVEVFGAVWPFNNQPTSTYSIDGVQISSFQPPAVTSRTSRVLFFSSPILPEGEHTLSIGIIAIQTEYLVDYILYTPSNTSVSKRGLVSDPITDISPLQRTSATTLSGGLLPGVVCILVMCMLFLGLRRRRNGQMPRSLKLASAGTATDKTYDSAVV